MLCTFPLALASVGASPWPPRACIDGGALLPTLTGASGQHLPSQLQRLSVHPVTEQAERVCMPSN
jgi:hypothetical protein